MAYLERGLRPCRRAPKRSALPTKPGVSQTAKYSLVNPCDASIYFQALVKQPERVGTGFCAGEMTKATEDLSKVMRICD